LLSLGAGGGRRRRRTENKKKIECIICVGVR